MRDLIIDYISKVKGGIVTRDIDNNLKLTGFEYDEELRAQVVRLVNQGKSSIPKSDDGRTPNVKSLTMNDVLVANGTKKVELLHFNDLHGNVEEGGKNIGAAKLAAAIKAKTSMNDFSNARNMYDTNIVMRGGIINYWKVNGVNTDFRNLLVMGKDDTNENVEEPGTNSGTDPDKDTDQDKEETNLPNTGEEGFKVFLLIALISLIAGFELVRKKEKAV